MDISDAIVQGVMHTDKEWQEKSEKELIWAGTTANFAFLINGFVLFWKLKF